MPRIVRRADILRHNCIKYNTFNSLIPVFLISHKLTHLILQTRLQQIQQKHIKNGIDTPTLQYISNKNIPYPRHVMTIKYTYLSSMEDNALNIKMFNDLKQKKPEILRRAAAAALSCLIMLTGYSFASGETPGSGSAPAPDPTSKTPAAPSQQVNDGAASALALNINAKAAVLMDAASGRVLYKQAPDEKLPPASVTKIMTMLLICEALDSGRVTTDDTVTISDRAAGMGGSQMYMEPGETHTLGELLTGISMVSANDACVAAAEYISGSVEIFVEEMNKRASSLGLQNTHFVNTNGLPVADHYSSAYDIAVVSAELLKHDIIIPYLAAPSGTAVVGKSADKQTTLEMVNTNKLLRSYSGAIGIKTGFTQDAGYCLSAAAERNGLRLIAVVLGCESSKIRFAEASRLLDYGFASYEAVQIAVKDELVGSASVDKGITGFTDLRAGENIQFLVQKGTSSDISYSVKPYTDLAAPIKAGQKAGTLIITKNGKKTAEYCLFADNDVKKAGLKTLMIHSIEKLMKG